VAIVPTKTAATSGSTVVSTSSRELIVSDRYGRVWKKSNDTAAASAVMMPDVRPPRAATATTTIISTSAALVPLKNDRAVAIAAATATVTGRPTATPITRPGRSMIG
jgi:hypothetical protein